MVLAKTAVIRTAATIAAAGLSSYCFCAAAAVTALADAEEIAAKRFIKSPHLKRAFSFNIARFYRIDYTGDENG